MYIYEPLGVRIHHCNRYVRRSNWHVLGRNLPPLAPCRWMCAETHRQRAAESHRMSANGSSSLSVLWCMSSNASMVVTTALRTSCLWWYPWQRADVYMLRRKKLRYGDIEGQWKWIHQQWGLVESPKCESASHNSLDECVAGNEQFNYRDTHKKVHLNKVSIIARKKATLLVRSNKKKW